MDVIGGVGLGLILAVVLMWLFGGQWSAASGQSEDGREPPRRDLVPLEDLEREHERHAHTARALETQRQATAYLDGRLKALFDRHQCAATCLEDVIRNVRIYEQAVALLEGERCETQPAVSGQESVAREETQALNPAAAESTAETPSTAPLPMGLHACAIELPPANESTTS